MRIYRRAWKYKEVIKRKEMHKGGLHIHRHMNGGGPSGHTWMNKHPLFIYDLLNVTRQTTCPLPRHGRSLDSDTAFNTPLPPPVPFNMNEQDYFRGLPVQDLKAYGEVGV